MDLLSDSVTSDELRISVYEIIGAMKLATRQGQYSTLCHVQRIPDEHIEYFRKCFSEKQEMALEDMENKDVWGPC